MTIRSTPDQEPGPGVVPSREDATVADEAAYRLRRLVVERRLGADDKLPSERELTEILGVSRTSVRAALKEMEAIGLVSISARRGAFVARDQSGGLGLSLRGLLETNRLSLPHLIEFRRAIEPAAAGAAAKRRTQDDLDEMAAQIAAMQLAVAAGDPLAYAAADAAFHNRIAAASQNPLFSVMLQSLAGPLRAFREGVARIGAQILTRSLSDHIAIDEAIRSSDDVAAIEAMLTHVVETNVDFHIVAREEME